MTRMGRIIGGGRPARGRELRLSRALRGIAAVLLVLCAACGGDGSDDGDVAAGTNTPTPPTIAPTATVEATPISPTPISPTATRTPMTGARVAGLIVVNNNVVARVDDRLAGAPEAWMADPSNGTFDRALAYADWTVAGNETVRGTTGADGQFEIPDLGAGRYTLALTKTLNGNLLSALVPFAVGPDGSTVVAEVSWGQVRSVSTYTEGGVEVQEVRDPYGRWLTTRDGRISELGYPNLQLSDPDGDGTFTVAPCTNSLWICGPDNACEAGTFCGCVNGCPFCEDCGQTACQPPGLSPPPYRCDDNGGCSDPSHRCVGVSSCPDCDDRLFGACVADCSDVEITRITVSGFPPELVLGQPGNVSAVATLSDQRQIDVTTLVDWASSSTDIATVDSFGVVTTHAVGTTDITATLGDITSDPWQLTVKARPPLRHIYVQNINCYYPLGAPIEDKPTTRPPVLDAPLPDDSGIWRPSCNQVVQIGGTITFSALGEFGSGDPNQNGPFFYLDITSEATWTLNPANVGSVVAGVFTAAAAGTTQLTVALEGVESDATEIRVVTEPTVVTLSIYPNQGGYFDDRLPPVLGGALGGAIVDPCFECGYTFTVLRGDEAQFHATAHYDTGAWRDVTDAVTWQSSDAAVASIDAEGLMRAIAAGTAVIDASFEDVTSNPVTARVVTEATLLYLYMYQEGPQDRAVAKGGQLNFRAQGSYDLGFQRDVTAEVTWRSSNAAVGGFDEPGVFTGRSAGTTRVWAEFGGAEIHAQRTDPIDLRVFETSDITYCDPTAVNRGVWADDFNRVVLESDCAEYTPPDVVTLRYTVTESQRPGGIFNPCLDLYVFDGDTKIRTLREEGCGEPFIARGAPEFDAALPRYQLQAFWDLKDADGEPVAPGTYSIVGRFYLYYDPVVSIDVTVH